MKGHGINLYIFSISRTLIDDQTIIKYYQRDYECVCLVSQYVILLSTVVLLLLE